MGQRIASGKIAAGWQAVWRAQPGRWKWIFILQIVFVLAVAGAQGKQPNVLFIVSDDQAWNDYGFMGHPQIHTPALDGLASESLVFERGYSPVPLCRPALSTIITGLYPHQHGVTGNDPHLPEPGINPQRQRENPVYQKFYQSVIQDFQEHPNVVRDLVGRGYVALQTGKWWEGNPVKVAGFTHAMTRGQGKGARHGDDGLAIGRQGLDPVYRFLDQAGSKPFFIWYAPMLPHSPHNPPQTLVDKYLKVAPTESVARYWASVEWFDRSCGELLASLEERQLRSNTIVFYTTDNGYIPSPEKVNVFAPRSKRTPYEGGVRTPIMLSWPGVIEPGRDREHLASNIDLWPTLASLLKTPPPAGLPGIDLTDRKAVSGRARIFGESFAHDIADIKAPTRSLETRWMIDGWWKLIVPDPQNQPENHPELYNLKRDPWEKQDLAQRQPERVKQIKKKLDAWWPGNQVR